MSCVPHQAGSEGTLSPGAGGGPSLLHKDEEGLDSCADWLVIFDTEFSQNLGLKVRSTSQIPVSGTRKRARWWRAAGFSAGNI